MAEEFTKGDGEIYSLSFVHSSITLATYLGISCYGLIPGDFSSVMMDNETESLLLSSSWHIIGDSLS